MQSVDGSFFFKFLFIFPDNGRRTAINIIIVLSVSGCTILCYIICVLTFLTIVYLRKKKRNRKIDWYLGVLKDSERSFDETNDDVESNQYQNSKYADHVANVAYQKSFTWNTRPGNVRLNNVPRLNTTHSPSRTQPLLPIASQDLST